jgi:hypothetical protein
MYAASAGVPFYTEEISGDRSRAFELAESLARLLLSKGEGR